MDSSEGHVAEDLRAAVEQRMDGRVPGLSAAVVTPEGLAWCAGFGRADIASDAPATCDTAFNWFSMTKIATATAAMRLVDEGSLALEDLAIDRYPAFDVLRPSQWARAVTVRHLLSHSSGLTNPPPLKWVHLATEPGPEPAAFVGALLEKHPKLAFEPGSRANYTNLGYLVLGEIIAAVSGVSLQRYVRSHVLEPLQMSGTDFALTEAMGAVATAYQRRSDPVTPVLRLMLPHGLFGDTVDGFIEFERFYVDGAAYGGLIGSARDAARLLQLHLCDGELDGERILSAESAQLMREIRVEGRRFDLGLGWFRPSSERQSGATFVEHLGDGGGYSTVMRLYPDDAVGIVLMGNATSYDREGIIGLIAASMGAGG